MAIEPFLLRVVAESLADGLLVGEAQHIASGRSAVVRNVDELLEFLRVSVDETDLVG